MSENGAIRPHGSSLLVVTRPYKPPHLDSQQAYDHTRWRRVIC
jgi:hypothetical protein